MFQIQFGNDTPQVASMAASNVPNVVAVTFTNGTKAAVGKKHFHTEDGINYLPSFCHANGVLKEDEYEVSTINGTPWIVTKNRGSQVQLS